MKNSFIIHYAVQLWLTALGCPPLLSKGLSFILTRILGDMTDRGLILVDISIDKISQALKDKQWREAAQNAYGNAVSQVKSEVEKDEIRKAYMVALAKYATYGRGLSDNKNP